MLLSNIFEKCLFFFIPKGIHLRCRKQCEEYLPTGEQMNYKVKIIYNYSEIYENEDCHNDFMKILKIKKAGYDSKHNGTYFPLDRDDFFGIHVLILNEENDDIIFTFKVIPYSYCQKFSNITFPLLEYALDSKDPAAIREIENFMNEMKLKNHDFSYSGGWVMNPAYKNKGLSKELRELYTGVHLMLHKRLNLKAMTGVGILEMGTLDFFKNSWGVEEFAIPYLNISRMPNYHIALVYQHIDKVTFFKKNMAKRYEDIWSQRFEFKLLQEREIA